MEYDVLSSGHVLLPQYYLSSEEYGVLAFSTFDQDPEWRSKPRLKGRYVSTAWIPGNLLSEGLFYVGCGLNKLNPNVIQFFERQTVSMTVVDSHDGDSARGDMTESIKGVVRPLLEWETNYKKGLPDNMA